MAKKKEISYKTWRKIGMIYFFGNGIIGGLLQFLYGFLTFVLLMNGSNNISPTPNSFYNLTILGVLPPLFLGYAVKKDYRWVWPIAFFYYMLRLGNFRLEAPYNILAVVIGIVGMVISLGGWIASKKK